MPQDMMKASGMGGTKFAADAPDDVRVPVVFNHPKYDVWQLTLNSGAKVFVTFASKGRMQVWSNTLDEAKARANREVGMGTTEGTP